MDDIPLGALVAALLLTIALSAFFSAAETAMLSLNRHRLRQLGEAKHRGARFAGALLARPDRLIVLILLGNNFVNITAAAIATVIGFRLLGGAGIAIAVALLTVLILIFGEVTPKTFAAHHPERIAFPVSYLLAPLLRLMSPVVWMANSISNAMLRLLKVAPAESAMQQLSREELRTIVNEAGALIPRRHQRMLLSILDLEKVTVDDIMVPRNEVVGIDLDADLDDILRLLVASPHSRLPVYRESIDKIEGIIHIRDLVHLIAQRRLDKAALEEAVSDAYFVPESTPLNTQLLNFQRQKRRMALVVDEYGDIRGLITLEDLLGEIVGEFPSGAATAARGIHPQQDGSYVVDGSAHVRELNRLMGWELPTDGPKTINGLIIERLESIPEPGTSVMIAGYPIDIVHTSTSAVKTARIHPALRREPDGEEM